MKELMLKHKMEAWWQTGKISIHFRFLLMYLVMAMQSMAQTPDCSEKDYTRLMAEAKRLAEKGLYDKAIK